MKSRLTFAALALFAIGGTSQAQTVTPNAPVGQSLTPAQQANRERVKGERETCRTQAKGQGLKGEAVRVAVMDCMSKVDPIAAKRMGCRRAATVKNLTGDDLKKSMRQCMTGAA